MGHEIEKGSDVSTLTLNPHLRPPAASPEGYKVGMTIDPPGFTRGDQEGYRLLLDHPELPLHSDRDTVTRGFNICVNKEAPFFTSVSVMDELIKFALVEDLDRTERKLTAAQIKEKEKHPWMYSRQEFDYSPNGILSLIIRNGDCLNTRKTWSDGRRQRLEECLNSFVAGLAKAAIAIKHLRTEREQRELRWQEERRQWEESERIRWEEEEKMKGLDREVASWQRSQQIRSYIDVS